MYSAADLLCYPGMLERYLREVSPDVALINAKCRDALKGDREHAPMLYNMNILQDKYRPGKQWGDHPIWDGAFAAGVCKVLKKKRIIIKEIMALHHPVWTPKEMFGKIRESAPRHWEHPKMAERAYGNFLRNELKKNPTNKVLIVGWDLYHKMSKNFKAWVRYHKDPRVWHREWEVFRKRYKLTGQEFYAMPGWEKKAKKLLKYQPIIPAHIKVITE